MWYKSVQQVNAVTIYLKVCLPDQQNELKYFGYFHFSQPLIYVRLRIVPAN